MAQLVGNFRILQEGRNFYSLGAVNLNRTTYTAVNLHELSNDQLSSLISAIEAGILESNDTTPEEIRSLAGNVSLDVGDITLSDITVTNFPADQLVHGPVSVTNFPANQTVTVGNFPVSYPVSGTINVGNLPATQPVSGTLAISNFPATQPISGAVTVSNFPGSQAVTGPLTDTQLRASAVPISGSISVGNFPVNQTVNGTLAVSNFPATQTVAGSVTVSNFPATQPVSGTVGVTGTVAVSNFPGSQAVTGPATNTELRASPLPISGTVSVGNFPATQTVTGPLTDTQIRATPLPVSGAVSVSNLPATQTVTGSVNVGNFPATQTVVDTTVANLITSLTAHFPTSGPDAGNTPLTPPQNGTGKTVSINATTNVFTAASHGYSNGDPVVFTTDGTLPSPLTSTTTDTAIPPVTSDTVYYVGSVTTDTFKVYPFNSNVEIDLTTDGVGLHTVTKRGEYKGTWKNVEHQGSILSFYLQNTQLAGPGYAFLEWSDDGINTKSSSLFATTGIPQQITSVTTPFPITYYYGILVINNVLFGGRYYRLRMINGVSNPGFIYGVSLVGRDIATGTIGSLNDKLSQLSVVQLVRSVNAGVDPNDEFVNVRAQGSHRNNSSTALLGANGVYRGTWFPWQKNYIKLLTDMASDVSGTLYIDFAQTDNPVNGTDESIADAVPIPYNPATTPLLKRTTIVQSKWVRHRYINGVAAQAKFELDAGFVTSDPGLVTQTATLLPGNLAQIASVRGIATVRKNDGTGFVDWPTDTSNIPYVHVTGIDDDIQIRPNSNELFTQMSIGTSPVRLDPVQVANRRTIQITNHGPGKVAIGNSSGITFDTDSRRLNVDATMTHEVSDAVQRWIVAETTAGTQTVSPRAGNSGTGTATNPNNALLSNDTYANITAAAQNVNVTGFTALNANPIVTVRLGMEANRTAGTFETGAYNDIQSVESTGLGTLTSPSVTGGTAMTYLATITREGTATVTGVTGLGLTWSLVRTAADTAVGRTIDVWIAYGTATTGTVVATFSATIASGHLAVSRYTNIDQVAPVQNHGTTTGTTTAVTGPVLNGTNKGISVLAVAINNATSTAGAGYTERLDIRGPGTTNSADGQTVITKALTLTTTEAATATLNQNENWVAIGVTLSPRTGINPVVNLSYTLSAVAGATSGNVTLSSDVDSVSYVNVTADRSWTAANIPNVAVIATGSTVGAAAANVDQLFLETTDTTGNTARVSVWQAGAATS